VIIWGFAATKYDGHWTAKRYGTMVLFPQTVHTDLFKGSF